MNEYIRCCWFVKNLSFILSEKIIQKCALNSEDFSFMNFKKVSDAIVIYCNFVKALLKFLIMIKNFNDFSKFVNEYQIKWSMMSDKFFDSLIVAQLSDTIMNEMINKFEMMMLFLQTAIKKIESFMQNMTASVSMLNIYISCEFITSAYSVMLMSSLFSLSRSEWASLMFKMKECFFYEEIKCQKIKCCQLNIYKTEEKIHVNEANRFWMKLAERNDRLTFFALSCSQKDLINNALIWFDLIWFEFIHFCDIDLDLTHEKNYAMCIKRTKLSEKENRSSTTQRLHVVETIKLTLCYQ